MAFINKLFQQIGSTSNNAHNQAKDQLDRLLSAIDSAILSGAEINHIVSLAFQFMPDIIQSELVAISHTGKSSVDTSTTQILHKGKVETKQLPPIEKSLKNLLRDNPSGLIISQPEKYAVLAALIQQKATSIYACAIFKEGDIAAILVFGINQQNIFIESDKSKALAIANRLAVAMTASHRMKLLQIKEYFDPVTLLFNRQACQDRLSQEMSRARRQNKTLATFYLNINDFKKINDEFGYAVGDALLQLVGAKLKLTYSPDLAPMNLW
jgi:transcriptional regulator with GAF, ATPase, and Fis domain